MPPKKKIDTTEADAVFARASVGLAKSQKLVRGWLPPQTGDEEKNAGDREEEDLNEAGGNELLGIGATPPTSTSTSSLSIKRKDPSLEALRKQLLGRRAASTTTTTAAAAAQTKANSLNRPHAKPRLQSGLRNDDENDDEDDEGGRSAAFSSKSSKRVPQKTNSNAKGSQDHTAEPAPASYGTEVVAGDESRSVAPEDEQPAGPPAKRKATSYLDEVLAERGVRKKKKKKKKKKGKEGAEEQADD